MQAAPGPGAGPAALPTIFVSIPSYRDPECQYTVLDLFRKAQHPGRVRVGVCWQADREEDRHCFLLDLSEHAGRIRTLFLHHSEARGPCVARALIQQRLYEGEDFYFQLDSHYRMVEGWDEELLKQLSWCPSQRAVLTTYPSSYTLPDDYAPGGPDRARLHPGTDPIVVCAREFGAADGFLRTVGKPVRAACLGGSPAQGLFWAAGFAFSSGAVVREVPYDPQLEDLFFGEEPSMAARLWTAGWDFFAPTRVVGYHLWTRRHRPVFREHACDEQRAREAASQLRVRRLLLLQAAADAPDGPGGPEGPYGLGEARSLAAYEKFCGVSHWERRIALRARRGGLKATDFVDGDPAAAPPPQAAAAPAGSPQPPPGAGGPVLANVADAIRALAGLAAAGPPDGGGSGGAGTLDVVGSLLSAMAGHAPFEPPPCGAPAAREPPRLLQMSEGAGGRLALLRAADVEALNSRGFVVLDGFLRERCYAHCGAEHAAAAPFIVRRGVEQVPVRPAKLGRGDGIWSSASVRGDEMTWLSPPKGDGLRDRAERRVRVSLPDGRKAPATGEGAPAAAAAAAGGADEFDALRAQLGSAFGAAGGARQCGGAEAAGPPGGLEPSHLDALPAEGSDAPYYEELDVFLAQIVALRDELDEVLDFQSRRLSFMLAKYPGGGTRYARHLDALPEHPEPRRRITAVYYLNPSWTAADGGCLRLFLPEAVARGVPGAKRLEEPAAGEEAAWVLDVEPRLDRLLLFASGWLEHEVLPAHADRYAITGWFY